MGNVAEFGESETSYSVVWHSEKLAFCHGTNNSDKFRTWVSRSAALQRIIEHCSVPVMFVVTDWLSHNSKPTS